MAQVIVQIAGGCAGADPNSVYFDRFEGTSVDNTCVTDQDCGVSGCSGEVCAADIVFTTCESLPEFPSGSCGCVQGECIWSVCP